LITAQDQTSGSTLRRRRPAYWAKTGVLAKVHVLLAAMLHANSDLILNTCSSWAKHDGDHNITNQRGRQTLRLKCQSSQRQVRSAIPVHSLRHGPHPNHVRGSKNYNAECRRKMCHSFAIELEPHYRRQSSGSELGQRRWPVECSNTWILKTRCPPLPRSARIRCSPEITTRLYVHGYAPRVLILTTVF
jgi:hypothetical protein